MRRSSVVRFGASYTYLDAEVTEAFSASAATNPAFPGVPIGAFSPLVGERPFSRPANSGTLFVSYADGRPRSRCRPTSPASATTARS